MRTSHAFGSLALVLLVGCGSSSAENPVTPSTEDAGTPSATQDAGTPGTTPGVDAAAPPTPEGPPVADGLKIGTYIVLGDSISDQGGQPPFFYDLLHQNDDAAYPEWKGHDLATKYPGLTYVHAAHGGAEAGVYSDQTKGAPGGVPTLVEQVSKLDASYPGDVLVTITIGGNDLNYHAGQAITGADAALKGELAAHLKTALDELTKPGRFGSGKVAIVEANIYDATDGQGNWKTGGKCGPNIDVGKKADTDVFAAWNDVIAQAITATPGDHAFDLHGLFAGHGFNGQDRWFASDCLHPTKVGHNEIRKAIWKQVTGESL